MSYLEKSTLQKWLEIVISTVLLSIIPFLILWSKFGFYQMYYLIPVSGLMIGLFWAQRVRKKNRMNDYSTDSLSKTLDLSETWEEEEMRVKENATK